MTRITTHPGVILKYEFMVPLGLSAKALAASIRVTTRTIKSVVRGTEHVTADLALRLECQFGNSAELWLNLQQSHDLSKARRARQDDGANSLAANINSEVESEKTTNRTDDSG